MIEMPYIYEGIDIGDTPEEAARTILSYDEHAARVCLQSWFESLSSDMLINLLAWGTLLGTPMEEVLAIAIPDNGPDAGILYVDERWWK